MPVAFISDADVPTERGTMRMSVFFEARTDKEHIAISCGNWDRTDVPVRVHSECLTAEVFGSLKCDCRTQLDSALDYIAQVGGVVVYLRQEGRGIGLANKIRAYALQATGLDTYAANRYLNLPNDARSYEPAADILRCLGVQTVRLMTHNPQKIRGLEVHGIRVTGVIEMPSIVTAHNRPYLLTKRDATGHTLKIPE